MKNNRSQIKISSIPDKIFNSYSEVIEHWEEQDKIFKKEHPIKWFYKELLDEIVYLYSKIKNFYYDLKYGVENLFYWLPTIWKDRNWDEYYLSLILKKKLEFMEYNLRVNDRHVSTPKKVKSLQDCIEILNRIIDNGGLDDVNVNLKTYYKPKNLKGSRKKLKKVRLENSKYMLEDKQIDKDLKNLFNLMYVNYRTWWD